MLSFQNNCDKLAEELHWAKNYEFLIVQSMENQVNSEISKLLVEVVIRQTKYMHCILTWRNEYDHQNIYVQYSDTFMFQAKSYGISHMYI